MDYWKDKGFNKTEATFTITKLDELFKILNKIIV